MIISVNDKPDYFGAVLLFAKHIYVCAQKEVMKMSQLKCYSKFTVCQMVTLMANFFPIFDFFIFN